MATTIVTKNGSGAPTDSDLVAGELAVDLTNGRLYTTDLDSGGTVLELGTNPASDVTFGDNTKAIFGAGSDLQIYHDASDSIINDNGTGSLKLQQGGSTKLEVTATGVDVTGSVTADGLTVDTDTLVVDATNNRVGIGTDSPDTLLHLEGADGVPQLKFLRAGTVIGGIIRQTSNPYGLTYDAIDGNAGAPTHVFRTSVDGSTFTERMRIDASGNLGVGVTPNVSYSKLQVKAPPTSYVADFIGTDAAGDSQLTFWNSNQTAVVSFIENQTAGAHMSIVAGSGRSLKLGAGGTAGQVLLDASGNVGIGNSSPSSFNQRVNAPHLVVGSGSNNAGVTVYSGTADQGSINFADGTTTTQQYEGGLVYNHSSGYMGFHTNGGVERMRIDASGNLDVVGRVKTQSDLNVYGGNSGSAANRVALCMEGAGASRILVNGSGVGTNGSFKVDLTDSTGTVGHTLTYDASGNLLVGTTSSHGKLAIGDFSATGADYGVAFVDGSDIYFIRSSTSISTNNAHYQFYNTNGNVGSITTNGSATAFNTSSDQRLKDNIVDAPSASDDIDAIQVRSFDWKADGSHQKYGMVAQELQSVAPEAVSGDADSEEMMGVDYSKLVPMMLKEIQSLRARVAQLES